MKYSIVLGTQFGDEGKGSFTNYLCKNSYSPLVIRFNGGHQAGHTVLNNGIRHTFSSFGSGTLQNTPTFWSRFCTLYPIAMNNEYLELKKIGIIPEIYIDPLCPITTPYDVLFNINLNNKTKHGSVGVGFGTTIERTENYYNLYYQDIFTPKILKAKLENIHNYYLNVKSYTFNKILLDEMMQDWYDAIENLINNDILSKFKMGFNNINLKYDHIIFEGSQGILLDMDFGFFPNVTRSNTTSKNVYTLLNELKIPISTMKQIQPQYKGFGINTYYITRTYQTRHGNGYMSNENIKPELVNIENEINIDSSYQGNFRKSILDLDLIHYAIQSDSIFSNDSNKNIVITCLDQLKNPFDIKYTVNDKFKSSNLSKLIEDMENLFDINKFILGTSEGNFEKN